MINESYILSVLDRNPEAVRRAMVLLYSYQTMDEKKTHWTKHRNHRGFSVRTCKAGTELALKVLGGKDFTDAEWEKARFIAKWHRRQLVEAAKAKASAPPGSY